MLLLFWMTAALGINDQANETLCITTELKIMSQVTNFVKQILLFLAYGNGPERVGVLHPFTQKQIQFPKHCAP
jgi:hypothetical protein